MTALRSYCQDSAAVGRGPEVVLRFRAAQGEHSIRYYEGLRWQLGTAAYWEAIAAEWSPSDHSYALGSTLREEVAGCILGGFGMPAAMGIAALERLAHRDLLKEGSVGTFEDFHEALSTPLRIGESTRRYRFPRQRAERLELAMRHLDREAPADATDLRNWLTQIPGVGLKTASWIVRNWCDSDDVAIIDIHIARAATRAGIFASKWAAATDYLLMEKAFLAWARHARIKARILDASIWAHLAGLGDAGRDVLGVERLSDRSCPVWPVHD